MQQARARSVGRGGAIFRGTLQRLRIREKLRLGQNWRSRSTVDTVDANASAHAGGLTFASPGIADLSTIPELSRVTSTQAAAEHEFRPAEIEDVTQLTELKHARLELARQSLQLAELLAEAEKARNLAREQAQSSAQLLAAISHDLRTPLNAVIGFSDVMQRELFGPLGHDRYRDYAGHIRESGQQLLRAAENIIAMTRPRSD